MKDKELNAIIEIEKLLDGMGWMQKHRILDFVKARATFDPLIDGDGQPTLGTPIGLDK